MVGGGVYAPERRRRGHRGFTARCPSLLLALRSALLPVNLATRLRSGSDRRFQLAAACQGCGGGGPRMETVASVRALVSFYARKEREVSRDAAVAEPTVE